MREVPGRAAHIRKLRAPTVAVLLTAGVLGGSGVAAATPTTTITTCALAKFKSAVAKSDNVVFDIGAACTLTLTGPVRVPASIDLSISDSSASAVTLDGDDATQLFSVTGGMLDITGITLSGGFARGKTGTGGGNGVQGATGASGAAGATGKSGGAGKDGKPGTNGGAGAAGGAAKGGAIYIASGTVGPASRTLGKEEGHGGGGGAG